ncbi:sensor histidine kinase [uncultured Clostridium sp.]|uniref:sensor histidine kinase n=1 Tax=uncultured Clostridium sp. TaxID=59620 RepID=UPI0034A0CC87
MNIDLDETSYIGNEELLKQVWVNLIDNAIKFTDKKGRIDIQLMSFNDCTIFKIKDTGIGMTSETKKHIFDKFYQGDTSHITEGNGLGLTMVNKIINLHKGYIEVKSQHSKGTIITVTLPVNQ